MVRSQREHTKHTVGFAVQWHGGVPIVLMLTCATASCVLASCHPDPKTAEESCAAANWRAIAAAQHHDYSQAEEFYNRALEQSKQSSNLLQQPKVLKELSEAYTAQKKFDMAETCLKNALHLYDSLPKSYVSAGASRLDILAERVQVLEELAAILVKEGKLTEAEQEYTEALRSNNAGGGDVETSVQIRKDYANLLRATHHEQRADQLTNEVNATDISGNDLRTELLKASQSVRSGKDLDASAHRLQALIIVAQRQQKTNELIMALHSLGLAQLGCGQFQAGEAEFRKCLTLLSLPNVAGPYGSRESSTAVELAALACSLDAQNKTDEATSIYRRSLLLKKQWALDSMWQNVVALNQARFLDNKELTLEIVDKICHRLAIITIDWNKEKSKLHFGEDDISNMFLMIGQGYRDQGKYPQAQRAYQQVVTMSSNANNLQESTNLFCALSGLAAIYRYENRISDSQNCYRRAMIIFDTVKRRGTGAQLISATDALARLYEEENNAAQLESQMQLLLAVAQKRTGRNSLETAFVMHRLAVSYRNKADFAHADPLFDQAMRIYDTVQARPDRNEEALLLLDSALNCTLQRKQVQAEALYKRALAIHEQTSSHQSLLWELQNLVSLLQDCTKHGKIGETQPLAEKALSIYGQTNGTDAQAAAAIILSIAATYRDHSMNTQAETMFARAISICALKPEAANTIEMANLQQASAENYLAESKVDQAEPLLRQAEATFEKLKGADCLNIGTIKMHQAGICAFRGNLSQAESLYNQALKIYEKSRGLESAEVAGVLRDIGEIHRDRAEYAEAQRCFDKALAIHDKAKRTNGEVAWLLYLSALNCSAQKKFVDAERLFKRSIAVYEKLSGGHDTAAIADVYSQQTASALGCLAQNCVKQAKYTEAKSFFQRELAILESLKPTNNAAILAIKQALTQIEDKQHSAPARRI